MQFELSILFFVKRAKVDKAGRAPIYCRITVNGEPDAATKAEMVKNNKASSYAKSYF